MTQGAFLISSDEPMTKPNESRQSLNIKEDSQSHKMAGVIINHNATVLSQTLPYDEYLSLMNDLEANLKFVTDQLSSVREDLAAKSSEVEDLQCRLRDQDLAFSSLKDENNFAIAERERLSSEN